MKYLSALLIGSVIVYNVVVKAAVFLSSLFLVSLALIGLYDLLVLPLRRRLRMTYRRRTVRAA